MTISGQFSERKTSQNFSFLAQKRKKPKRSQTHDHYWSVTPCLEYKVVLILPISVKNVSQCDKNIAPKLLHLLIWLSLRDWVSPVASRQQSSSQVICWAKNTDNRLFCYCRSVTGRAAALWQQRNHWHLSVWEESMHSQLLSHFLAFYGPRLSKIGAKTGNCQFSKFEIALSGPDFQRVASWVSPLARQHNTMAVLLTCRRTRLQLYWAQATELQ